MVQKTKMKTIPLTQGQFAIVDDEDFEELNKYKWCAIKRAYTFYAKRDVNGRLIAMHRIILHCKEGLEVDHINGNGIDNRKENIRVCTKINNLRNRKRRTDSFCKYKGVYFNKRRKRWNAYITVDRKRISLKTFSNPIDAAIAYNTFAIKYFGEFAKLNDLSSVDLNNISGLQKE
jgi:hypothetical protein